MERVLNISRSESNYLWVRFQAPICEECGEIMYFKCHGNPRILNMEGKKEKIIQCYYECRTEECPNTENLVARHPEIVYKKLYSKGTFARVMYLKYVKKFSVNQILEELPYMSKSTCYEMIRAYRAASKVRADDRIAEKFPLGTKIYVSIDAMEPEKGQPALYTVRDVSEGELLGAKFLSDSSADTIYGLMAETERKYGIVYAGFVSDKQTGIIAMHDKYYPDVHHQYCIVHFLDNATKELRAADKTLQKELRSDVRNINTLKTIKKKVREGAPDLAEKERIVLAETKDALLAVVNQKKTDKFELAGKMIHENLSKALTCFHHFMSEPEHKQGSSKFQLLFKHLVEKLFAILEKHHEAYHLVIQVDQYLSPIFEAVSDPHPKHPKRAFKKVVKSWKTLVDDETIPENVRGLVATSLKFALSYERGLFLWLIGDLPKTNNGTEIFYHEQKGRYRQNSPNMKIGPTLSLTGPEEMFVPKNLTREEILLVLEKIGSPDYWDVRAEMEARSARRSFNRRCRKDIQGVLWEIFNKLKER